MKKTILLLSLAGLVLLPELCQAQSMPRAAAPAMTLTKMDKAKRKDWLARWDDSISGKARGYRTCDREVGEGIAWGMTPIMDGFYYGYMATKDAKYVAMWADWTDSLVKRAVKEPITDTQLRQCQELAAVVSCQQANVVERPAGDRRQRLG